MLRTVSPAANTVVGSVLTDPAADSTTHLVRAFWLADFDVEGNTRSA